MICALAGGVGGARLADGLARAERNELRIVVNTGDDFQHLGLTICPDLDTVMYTLAGLANAATGWGIAGDTASAMDMLRRYGGETWFYLSDGDLGTHLYRTDALRRGQTLTQVSRQMATALGIKAQLLPMSDSPVATRVLTPDGELEFQEYFVRRRCQDTVLSVRWEGLERAVPTPEAMEALREADTLVICPSNPIVSVGPIVALPGVRDALRGLSCPRVGVSPIIGGQALKGPADRMLASLGHESSVVGVARLYRDMLDGFVIDHQDATHMPALEALGLRVLVTDAIMRDPADRVRLAIEVLDFAESLRRVARPA